MSVPGDAVEDGHLLYIITIY